MARLFFALWPDEDVRRQISLRTDALNLKEGRRLQAGNYHMTLAFLGNITEQAETRLSEYAATIQFPVCEVCVDHSGWWQKPKIAWLAPSHWPASLTALAESLNSAAVESGISMPERVWRPHITVARKIKQPREELEIEPIYWQIKRFCLVQSITGNIAPEYQVKASWPLKIM